MLINVKMPTIVGILTFMSRKNCMLNSVEHEKSFITSGPGYMSSPGAPVFAHHCIPIITEKAACTHTQSI